MNKDIKEILRYLKIENGTIGSELSYEETHLLLDYINNLQKEIKKKDNKIHALEKHNKKLNLEAQKYFDLLMECEYKE